MADLLSRHRIDLVMAANDVIKNVDVSIRSEAFKFLLDDPSDQGQPERSRKLKSEENSEALPMTDFFGERRGSTPAENALLVAGYLYGCFGTEPFSVDEIKTIAGQV